MAFTITLHCMSVNDTSPVIHIYVYLASLAVLPLFFLLAELYCCFWPSWLFIPSSMLHFYYYSCYLVCRLSKAPTNYAVRLHE